MKYRPGYFSAMLMMMLSMGGMNNVVNKPHPKWFYEIEDLPEEYEKIKRKESSLSANQRQYIINLVEKIKKQETKRHE